MPSMLERLVSTHFSQLKITAGVVAVYRRGDEETKEITVVPGNRFTNEETNDGTIVRKREDDVLILAADITLDPSKPQPFDEIDIYDESGGDIIRQLQVIDPPFDSSDSYGRMLRVHCQKVD